MKNSEKNLADSPVIALPKVPRYRWVVLAWICLCFLAFSSNWFQISSALPSIREDLKLSATEAMNLVSLFIATYGLFQLPSGLLAVKWGAKKTFVSALFLETVCSSLIYFAPDYMTLLILRLIAGVGGGLFFSAAVSAFVPWFIPTGELGLAMGLSTTSFFFLGQSISIIAGPLLITLFGWRTYFLLLGVTGIIIAILAIPIVKAPPKEILPPASNGAPPSIAAIFKVASIWLLGFAVMGSFGASNTLIPFLPTFLKNFRGWDYRIAGIFTGMVGLASIVLSPIVGILVDRFGPRKPQLVVAGLLTSVFIWLFGQLDAPLIWILPFISAVVTSFITINSFAAPIDYLGPILRGAGLGLMMEIAMVAQTWIPTYFGMLVDTGVAQYGEVPEATSSAWLFLALINLTIVILGLIIKEPRESSKIETGSESTVIKAQ